MKIYKFLDIDADKQLYISNRLYNYVLHFTNILERKWLWNTINLRTILEYVPDLQKELRKIIDHDITMVAIVYRSPNAPGGIHIDSPVYKYRALWPIKNCEGSYTKFFDLNGNDIIEKIGQQGDKHLAIREDNPLIEIESIELSKPIVFNTQIPHGVYPNPKFTEPRLSATIGFGNYPLENLLRD